MPPKLRRAPKKSEAEPIDDLSSAFSVGQFDEPEPIYTPEALAEAEAEAELPPPEQVGSAYG